MPVSRPARVRGWSAWHEPDVGNSNNDTIKGSAGDDKVLEAGGNDQMFLGAGNDVVDYRSGDGDDLLEGGAGIDSLILSASSGSPLIAANGTRTLLTRGDGSSIDMNDVERIHFSATTAAGFLSLNDLANTDVQLVALDLGDPLGTSGTGRTTASRSARRRGTTRSARPSARAWFQ